MWPGVRTIPRSGLECMEWCAEIGLADILHSAEKGDWRLSRFGKKGRKHDRITRRRGVQYDDF